MPNQLEVCLTTVVGDGRRRDSIMIMMMTRTSARKRYAYALTGGAGAAHRAWDTGFTGRRHTRDRPGWRYDRRNNIALDLGGLGAAPWLATAAAAADVEVVAPSAPGEVFGIEPKRLCARAPNCGPMS